MYPGAVLLSAFLRSCHLDKIYSSASFFSIPIHVQDTVIISSWLDGKCRNLSWVGRSVLVSKIFQQKFHWCFLSWDLVCHSQLISPIPHNWFPKQRKMSSLLQACQFLLCYQMKKPLVGFFHFKFHLRLWNCMPSQFLSPWLSHSKENTQKMQQQKVEQSPFPKHIPPLFAPKLTWYCFLFCLEVCMSQNTLPPNPPWPTQNKIKSSTGCIIYLMVKFWEATASVATSKIF